MIIEFCFIVFEWIRQTLKTDRLFPQIKNLYQGFFRIFFDSRFGHNDYSFDIKSRHIDLKERIKYFKFRPSPGFCVNTESFDGKYKNIVLGTNKKGKMIILQFIEPTPLPQGLLNTFGTNMPTPVQPATSQSVGNITQISTTNREELYGYVRNDNNT